MNTQLKPETRTTQQVRFLEIPSDVEFIPNIEQLNWLDMISVKILNDYVRDFIPGETDISKLPFIPKFTRITKIDGNSFKTEYLSDIDCFVIVKQ